MEEDSVFERLTFARVRVLAGLGTHRTLREVADCLGISYNGLRSHVDDLKRILACPDTRSLARCWEELRPAWLEYCVHQANGGGYYDHGTDRTLSGAPDHE